MIGRRVNATGLWMAALALAITAIVVFDGFSRKPQTLDIKPARVSAGAWDIKPLRTGHTDHAELMQGPFETPQDITRACLDCHPKASEQVMMTSHWTWLGPEAPVPGHEGVHRIGKKNIINNFCIGVPSNWARCTSCHVGYGWKDDSFDFNNKDNVDCLVCHDRSGQYVKEPTGAGYPASGVNLLKAAQSVGAPTRKNCGACHFSGGGGDGIKHGDMNGVLENPSQWQDVHMGKYGFECQDCHRTTGHQISGRLMSVSADNANRVHCEDCHTNTPHVDQTLNRHTGSIACQTCHIKRIARNKCTKLFWDWSQAGQDQPSGAFYNKKKGRFVLGCGVLPEYKWYNGTSGHYLLGDAVDPEAGPVSLSYPIGDRNDPNAKITPFKHHGARQIYDPVNKILILPKLFGKDGYWATFDWDQAARLGAQVTGLPYSGQFGFIETEMYWPLDHTVLPKEGALHCADCHAQGRGVLDWKALGYDAPPRVNGM